MTAQSNLIIILLYFTFLLLLSFWINRKSGKQTFFDGDRKSPWFVVAFGMIGATLSGVTFISVPGEVGNSSFFYLQFVLGNFVGYLIIAFLLLPFYYKNQFISIYSVLSKRMGREGYLTSSGFFIVSKVIGAAFRLYLAALVIHLAIAKPLGIPFELTVLLCLLVIYVYTVKSGIKMVVWSDLLQTSLLLLSVVLTVVVLLREMNWGSTELLNLLQNSEHSSIFNFEWQSSNNFFKQFVAGIFMTIAINGFDQDIMQKNLTCSSSSNARKNMLVFSFLFVLAVSVFLVVGALLYAYAAQFNVPLPEKTDQLFPSIALNKLGIPVAIFFILGLSAAAISSADSATTALTTAFCVDFLKIESNKNLPGGIRNYVHLGFILLIYLVIVLFYRMNNESVIIAIFKAAAYTYGPILGIFLFAFFVKRLPRTKLILPISVIAPIITGLLALIVQSKTAYRFGFELIVINASLTLVMLTLFSKGRQEIKNSS